MRESARGHDQKFGAMNSNAPAHAFATPVAHCPAAQAAWVPRKSGLIAERALATTFRQVSLQTDPCPAARALQEILADAGERGPQH